MFAQVNVLATVTPFQNWQMGDKVFNNNLLLGDRANFISVLLLTVSMTSSFSDFQEKSLFLIESEIRQDY